jgi:hypothetical protein
MIRLPFLLVISSLHGACSPEQCSGNSMAATNDEIAAAGVENRERARAFGRGTDSTMTQERIVISSDRGRVIAELVDNDATRALVRLLPVTIEMRDHLRQEKTGTLPSPLPELQRQTEFSAGTLGLWGDDDFVIYYRSGRVPLPGIIVLGRVTGDLSIFDHPGPVTVRLQHAG